MKKQLAAAVILTVTFGGASVLFAQQPAPIGPDSAKPQIETPREVLPSNPGQVAPPRSDSPRPDFQQPLPGQQGTIPEVAERPSGTNRMVISPDDVRQAQQALKDQGYDPGTTGGTLDTKTQDALRKFQKDNNLLATGVLDEKTAAKLGINKKQETSTSAPKKDASPMKKDASPMDASPDAMPR